MSTLEKAITLLQKMPEYQIYAVYMFALFIKEHPDIINPAPPKQTEPQRNPKTMME